MQISIVMSVYNGEHYLTQAMDSLLSQTFPDFDVIVVNDGSTDGTTRILDDYAKQDLRVRILSNPQNIGLAVSLNRGMEEAGGKYIARMDADDISLPQRLEKQFEFMETHPDVGILGTAIEQIDSTGRVTMQRLYPSESILICWQLMYENPICHPSVMLRRTLLKNNQYNPDLITAQDYDLWSRLAGITLLANLPDVLLRLRKHGRNLTYQKEIQQRENSYLISQKYIESLLDRPISQDTARDVWHYRDLKNPNHVLITTRILDEVARSILSKSDWSTTERQVLQQKIAHTLFEMARKCTHSEIIWWQIIIRIMCLNPAWLIQKTILKAKKGLGSVRR